MKLLNESVLLLKNWRKYAFFAGFLVFFVFLLTLPAYADTVAELQNKIQERNQQLQELETEIARYEEELTKVGADRATLEKEIARLDLSRRKIATDIAVTENRIDTADLQLSELETEIIDKERRIDESRGAIQKSLQQIARIDDVPLVEHFLAGTALSDAWETADQLRRVQVALGDEVLELEAIRDALEGDYQNVAKKQGQLVSFRRELSGQKSILDQNRQQQSSVLTVTKSKESEFQKLLDEKQESREQLEAELRDFESELQYTLDPSTIPRAGSGTLIFPLEESFMQRCDDRQNIFGNLYCLTQYFGNTQFAQSGAYNGSGHNGIDFGAPEGTKVVSSLAGIVVEVGDTDKIINGSKIKVNFTTVNVRSAPNGSILGTQRRGKAGIIVGGPTAAGNYTWWKVNFNQGASGWVASTAINNACYSYGKWALVQHANGLATLYAHLSHISVETNEAVPRSGLLGYSGNTGYSTGPHLHFTVYVADEVRIVRLGEIKPSTNCPAARIPVAPTEAYLNPLSYL